MSAPTSYKHLRKSGVQCTPEDAAKWLTAWVELYPEMDLHFTGQKDGTVKESVLKGTKSPIDEDDDEDTEELEILYDDKGNAIEEDRTVQLYSRTNMLGMVKRRGSANACCNFDFQPVAAVANKIALWMLFYGEWKRSRELGVKPRYKMVNFIHK